MASSIALLSLLVAAFAVTAIEARAIPDPMPLVMDVFGSPMMIVRDKRASYANPYAQRAMLFTGFYRPARRSTAGTDQAGGVYAQGNAVGGGAYFAQPQYLREDGPEPVDEPEITSADAVAAPATPENEEEAEHQEPVHEQHNHHEQEHEHREQEHEHREQEHEHREQEHHKDEHEESADQPQGNSDSEAEKPAADPEPAEPEHPTHNTPTKTHSKTGKKIPLPAAPEDDEEEYDDEEEDDEPLAAPFVPPKVNKGRRNKNYPSLNNYFPMVFTFPRGVGRRGSSSGVDSIPGMITAIANSYSTSKGGIASSVATAYGGAPTKKPRRTSQQSTK